MKKNVPLECVIVATDTFLETATLTKLPAPEGFYELKFETRFLGAKDPLAKQTKAKIFMDEKGLENLRTYILQA